MTYLQKMTERESSLTYSGYGVKKNEAKIDEWLKDITLSDKVRK